MYYTNLLARDANARFLFNSNKYCQMCRYTARLLGKESNHYCSSSAYILTEHELNPNTCFVEQNTYISNGVLHRMHKQLYRNSTRFMIEGEGLLLLVCCRS